MFSKFVFVFKKKIKKSPNVSIHYEDNCYSLKRKEKKLDIFYKISTCISSIIKYSIVLIRVSIVFPFREKKGCSVLALIDLLLNY